MKAITDLLDQFPAKKGFSRAVLVTGSRSNFVSVIYIPNASIGDSEDIAAYIWGHYNFFTNSLSQYGDYVLQESRTNQGAISSIYAVID